MRRQLTMAMAVLLLASPVLGQIVQRSSAAPPRRGTLDTLNQRIPQVEFFEQPFVNVVDWLEQMTGATIHVRWETLEFNGVEKETPVSIKADNLRFSQVLYMVMNEASGPDLVLAYRASGEHIELSTSEDLGREVITRVYDVADLMIRVPSTQRPLFQQNQGLGQQGQGGGQSIFGQQQNQQQQQDQDTGGPGEASAEMQALIDLIKAVVEPDTWADNGGTGTIAPWRNLIVVTNTIVVHQRLAGYVTEADGY
jgi:hypothetical protein